MQLRAVQRGDSTTAIASEMVVQKINDIISDMADKENAQRPSCGYFLGMIGLKMLILDLIHEFNTLPCRATMQIAYVYHPREEDDGKTPTYPESVEIVSVQCLAFDIRFESGVVFTGFAGPMIRPSLNEAAVTAFRVEVEDDQLEAMCLEDARSKQES